MGLIAWLKGRAGNTSGQAETDSWRQAWRSACANPTPDRVDALRAALAALAGTADDVEIEQEMLDGLADLVALRDTVARAGLPVIETGHRVVGADRCHFSATASMPDDPGQPAGRLLLTGTRAIFVGGARAISVPWHSVVEIVNHDRDLLLVQAGRDAAHRFRCNIYGEALAAAFLARQLAPKQRRHDRSV
jgi:hypothetical protein